MGSLVLAHAMFARLKRKYPGASLHALVFAKNREVLDLLGVMPPENVLTVSDRSRDGVDRRRVQGGEHHSTACLRRRHRLRAVRPRQRHLLVSVWRACPRRVLPPHAGRALPGHVHQSPGDVQPLHAPDATVRRAGRRDRLTNDSRGEGCRAPAARTASAAAVSRRRAGRGLRRGWTPTFPDSKARAWCSCHRAAAFCRFVPGRSNTIARCAQVSSPTVTQWRSSDSAAISHSARTSSLTAAARTAWT